MIRFIATGDLQIHKWKQFSYTMKNGMNSRLYNCLKVMDVILEQCQKRKINKVLLNGDIFEECDQIDVEVFDGFYQKLEALYAAKIETVINLGNHDIYGESGRRILHSLRTFRKVARIVEEPQFLWDCLQLVPWMSSVDRFKETIQSLNPSKEDALALHVGVQGARTGPTSVLIRNPIQLGDLRYKEFGLVILSDYHTRQFLQRNVFYLGSPLQHSFGEIHRPCIWEISIPGGGLSPRMEKIFTAFPRFRRVSAVSEDELSSLTKDFKGDYVKVAAADSLTEGRIQRVANRIGYQVTIEREGDEEEEAANPIDFDIHKVMHRYVKHNVKSKRVRNRLLTLGEKLYRGNL